MRKVFFGKREAMATFEVFPAKTPDAPVIYLNTFGGEAGKVYKHLQKTGCPDFTLVGIKDLRWDHDMTPWYCPPIMKGDSPCTGGADDYLKWMLEEVLPAAEQQVTGAPAWRGLAGYSLAGLFAVYAMFQTDTFERIASMSGSMWFPDFDEYVYSHEPVRTPDALYLSLGDKEAKTRNRYLKPVQERTEAIYEFYKNAGLNTTFVLNPGNHYLHGVERTAAGIQWILEN